MADHESCLYCEGEGYDEDVEDYTADWVECRFCNGTGDRYGRGPKKPQPTFGSFAPAHALERGENDG